MNIQGKNINNKKEFDLITNSQVIINVDLILKANYLDALVDQMFLEHTKKKDFKNNNFQSNNISKIKCSKKTILLYLLINFYISLILLTFVVFFFIIDPFQLVHN